MRVAQSKFLQNVSLNSGNKSNLNSSSVGNRMPTQVHQSTNHTCMSAASSTKNSHSHAAQQLGSPQRGGLQQQSEVLHSYQMQRYAGGSK